MENNRRFLLAIALTVLVIVATNLLFPSKRPTVPAPAATPTAQVTPGAPGAPAAAPAAGLPGAAGATVGATVGPAGQPAGAPTVAAVPAETASVAGARATLRIGSVGAALVGSQFAAYRSLVPGAGRGAQQVPAQIARPGVPLLSYRLAVPGDTLDLARVPFRLTRTGSTVRLDGVASGRVVQNVPVAITYAIDADGYVLRVQGSATGITGPSFLLVDLPPTLANTERDSLDHYSHLSWAWKPETDDASGAAFAKLDAGERRLVPGPLAWAVVKSKYFMVGVLAPRGQPFSELALSGGVRTTKAADRGQGTLVVPLANGGFQFDAYVGPQEFRRLAAMGREFETSNPYGGWLQGLVQPFATMAIRTILWLHDTFRLSYGWVLIVLGVVVRLLLWPLQQNAMRSQLRMQRIQPDLQLIQQKHKNDPQRLQQEMMKVYAEHGVSPFSALTGCLPMLLPMPIFFALFFVFQNTIEFRGVPFLWMGDISAKDPFFVLPVLVALTSFLMSWIGMRGAPPNPQTQMITYMMPAMFLFFFISVAAGLNLYYLTQNLVALPQQWLLARERTKANVAPVVQGTPTPVAARARR